MSMFDLIGVLGQTIMGKFSGSPTTVNLPGANQPRDAAPGGSLPPIFPGGFESFESISFEDLNNNQKSFQIGQLNDFTQAWKAASEQFADNNTQFHDEIKNAISDGWRGDAAQRANDGVKKYVEESGSFADALKQASRQVDIAASGFQQVQDQFPEELRHNVVDVIGGGALGSLLGGSAVDFFSEHVGAEHRQRAQAVRVMNTVYKPAATESDAAVPTLPAAYNPVVVQSNPSSDGNGTYTDGRGTGPTPELDRKSIDTPSIPPQAVQPASVGSTPATTGADPLSQLTKAASTGLGDATAAGPDKPAGTAAAAATSSPGIGSSGGAGAGLGGRPGSSSGGGAASPAKSFLQPAVGFAGQPGVGGPGGSAGGAAAASRGAPGAPGAGMGGGRGKGDDDKEHKTADYLVNIDNGNELIGKMPKVAPPVIGG